MNGAYTTDTASTAYTARTTGDAPAYRHTPPAFDLARYLVVSIATQTVVLHCRAPRGTNTTPPTKRRFWEPSVRASR